MTGWLIDPFRTSFMMSALLAALMAVVATSLVGTWVVLRGMSFLGDALAHGVLPGIAIAYILHTSLTLGAFVAALAMVGAVNLIRRHSPLPDDTSIGVLFVGFLSLGVVVMSGSAGGAGDLNRFLFGSITGVGTSDLVREAVALGITLVGLAAFHRRLWIGTFDRTQAVVVGAQPRLTDAALMVLVVVAIVASFQAVGNLLVMAFLIAPPATAALVGRSVWSTMWIGALVGALAAVSGLLVSYHRGTAAGATMALIAVVIFLAAVLVSSLVRSRRYSHR